MYTCSNAGTQSKPGPDVRTDDNDFIVFLGWGCFDSVTHGACFHQKEVYVAYLYAVTLLALVLNYTSVLRLIR